MSVTLDTQESDSRIHRVRASDLRLATSAYKAICAEDNNAVVSLDVEFIIAPTAHAARLAYLAAPAGDSAVLPTVRYVGTPLGLAGLIADVGAARVADGVTLIPLGGPTSTELLMTTTVPRLVGGGIMDDESVEALRAALGVEAL